MYPAAEGNSDVMVLSGVRNPDEVVVKKNMAAQKEHLQSSYGATKKSTAGFKTSRNSVKTSNYKQQRSWFSPSSSGAAYSGVNNSISQNKAPKTSRGMVSALNIIDPNASGRATKKSQVLSPKQANKSGNSSLYNQRSQTIQYLGQNSRQTPKDEGNRIYSPGSETKEPFGAQASRLAQIPFFCNFALHKTFYQWKHNTSHLNFNRRRVQLYLATFEAKSNSI